jgi:ABC-type multidrug transport system fused ATPase/permease subunit
MLNTTIKKNIKLGKPEATDEEVKEALQKTNSWQFVEKQELGIET